MLRQDSTQDEKDIRQPLLTNHQTSNQNDSETEATEKKENKLWIPLTIIATVLFTVCNSAFSKVSSMGAVGQLYLGPGPFLCGIVFFSYQMVQEKRKNGRCSVDMNLKGPHGSGVKWWNVVGQLGYSFNYITIQFMVLTTFALCFQAGLNAGIVTTIWSITPLFSAFFDKIIFGQKLATRHLIGVICLVISAAAISLSGVLSSKEDPAKESVVNPTASTLLPVLFALATPIFFTSNGLLMKYLTGPKRGFDSFKLSFAAYCFVGFILSIFLLHLAISSPETFNIEMLWIGLFGSIVNTIGIVLYGKAVSIGPFGPVSALSCIQSIMFSFAQAFVLQSIPMPLELIGSFIGIMGALVLTIPDQMRAILEKIAPCFVQRSKWSDPKPHGKKNAIN